MATTDKDPKDTRDTPKPHDPNPLTGPTPYDLPPQGVPQAPGGMASDPAATLAIELITRIRGYPDRLREQMESNTALKNMMEQSANTLAADVAQTIRSFANEAIANATGGTVPTRLGGPKPTS